MGQRRLDRARRRQHEVDETEDLVEEDESRGVARMLHNFTIETAGTEEGAVGHLEDALGMEEGAKGKGGEGGEGTLKALGSLEFLTHDAEPIGTTLVDSCNGFNELSSLAMLWAVRHRWPAGARFAFN